jgi:predicted acylesterase/phospholipase RssA
MRRRPQPESSSALKFNRPLESPIGDVGLVLSGGGVRAAYQAGSLRALAQLMGSDIAHPSVIVGSSIGAINGLVLGATIGAGIDHSVSVLEELWRERTFGNTFGGSMTLSFVRAIRIAIEQYVAPGPHNSSTAVFDPSPLRQRIDDVINSHGGLSPETRAPFLRALGVMTTVEGPTRRPLLFLSSHQHLDKTALQGASFEVCQIENISAKHGFASAALPSILPAVDIDTEAGTVSLVDGGISQNIPIDPVVRLGASRIVVIDISGRAWWLDRYGERHDTRPSWEVPAGTDTFCMRPPELFVVRNQRPFGPILKQAVGGSTKRFMASVGAIWPLFSLIKRKLGEEAAYEVMTYVALDPEFMNGLMEMGYHETTSMIRERRGRFVDAEAAAEALRV